MTFLERLRNLLNNNPFKHNFVKNRMRPPGAIDEKAFMERCIRCARCIAVCPYRCIERSASGSGIRVGTPYIYAEKKGCYLCMSCPPVCPTGALNNKLSIPEDVRMGVAVINENTCLNHIYARAEEMGYSDGSALYCNTCYNACPLQGKAVILKDLVIPVITDLCTGCGICAERCPTSPKSVEIFPSGMGAPAGIYFYIKEFNAKNEEVKKLLEEKERITVGKEPTFEYDFNTDNKLEGW
ncbi:MAG: 4Fe-4S dicluster domain-containing protein [Deferribacteraceae bacterium]|jgi:ferredoxin-type protein NapG|nr:4Fe-4S dicluster domain-containing protein [Deferribacteraceae bacterium]